MSNGWGWRWPMAAVATAIALTAVGIALWQPQRPAVRSTNTPAQRGAAADAPRPLVIPPHDAPVSIPVRQQRTPVVAAPRRTIEIALPPVIIAENETRAFAVLVRTAPTTRFDFVSPSAPSGAPLEVEKMPSIDPVTVDPIVIKPLVTE